MWIIVEVVWAFAWRYALLLLVLSASAASTLGALYFCGADRAADIITYTVNLLCQKTLREFKVKSLHMRGKVLTVEGFSLSTKTHLPYTPEFTVRWRRLRVIVQWRRLFIPFYASMHLFVMRAYNYLYHRCFRHYESWCCSADRYAAWCCSWQVSVYVHRYSVCLFLSLSLSPSH